MENKVRKSLKTFRKNVSKHFHRLIHRKESPIEAVKGIGEDAKKLGHVFKSANLPEDKKKSRRLVEKGRKAYNRKDYTLAEEYFQKAAQADDENAWAYTYLGYALYQLGKVREAANAWTRASRIDPDSEAAEKAEKKLAYLKDREAQTVDTLQGQLAKMKDKLE